MSKKNKERIGQPKSSSQGLLERGLAYHRAGSLSEALACYACLLKTDPGHADALNLSGVVARQQGDLVQSEVLIREAIRRDPLAATYHHSLARTCSLLGNNDEAAACFRKALSLDPCDMDSLQMLADVLNKAGDIAGALAAYEHLLLMSPARSEIYLILSSLYLNKGEKQQAIRYARLAVEFFPSVADCHFYLADCLGETLDRESAIAVYRDGLRLDPGNAAVLTRFAVLLHRLGHTDEAQRAYHEALRLNPEDAGVLSDLSTLALAWSALGAAELLLLRALQIDPRLLMAHCNLGAVYERQGRYLEATECFRKALTADPNHVATLGNLGLALGNMGDHAGAVTCYELALAREPDIATIQFNLSLEYLSSGDFLRGWAAYESRWRTHTFAGKRPSYVQPQWHGEELAGLTILIYSEQGLGDTLQFIRYVPLLAERGARVILQIQAMLVDLLRDTPGAALVLSNENDPTPPFDVHCPLMSLPTAFATTLEGIPPPITYPVSRHHARKLLGVEIKAPGLRVGVVWSGNAAHLRDSHRSIPLAKLAPLFDLEGVTFYSLQKGPGASQLRQIPSAQRPIDLEPLLTNFTHTAEAVLSLDLVITVDTAVCHLAGTIGKPVWILLPHVADWRWLRDRTDNPWYDSACLFRQAVGGRWEDVVDQVRTALLGLVKPLPLIPGQLVQMGDR